MRNIAARLILVMMFMCLMLVGQSIAKVDMGKAVAIWSFDEGKGEILKDTSGNGNDGKFVKVPKWVNGKVGKALEFSGAGDYVDCGNAESFNITDEITIVAWVNPADHAFAHQDFVGKPLAYILGHMDPPGPTLRCYINDGGWFGVDFTKPYTDYVGKWTHFAFTYDRSKLRVFVNGVLDREGARGGAISVNANHVLIAHSSESPGFNAFFKGIIDEAAIFNAALSDGDIKELMEKSLSGILAVSPSGKLSTSWAIIKSE